MCCFYLGLSYILDISCHDYSTVKSADDRPTTTDEEDIIEDMKEPLMYSHTPKGNFLFGFSVAIDFFFS